MAPSPNAEQLAAIGHTFGPLRIMAGAGAGKTYTLTERIVSLVDGGLATPSQILALTFTNKAVDELRERIDPAVEQIVSDGERVDIDTYHAFGSRIVADHGAVLGFPAEPLLLTSAESWIVLWRAIDEIDFRFIDLGNMKGGFGESPLRTIINLASRLSDELSTLDDLQAWLAVAEDSERTQKLSDYAAGLEVYNRRKSELGAIDYGDQIALACKLLEDPGIAASYAEHYRFLLVDEFQDTNYAQSVMVERLVGNHHQNVCVVGDPNQAIYAFRGASPDNLDRFADVFAGTLTLPLSSNYRSTQSILDLANHIWEGEHDPYRGNLRSAHDVAGARPLLVEAEDVEDELVWIAGKIGEVVESGRYAFRDIAVIVRKGSGKRAVFETLRAYGIPAELVGGESLYETREVREIISWFRAVADHQNDAAFAHVLMSDLWGLDERDIYALAVARQRGETLQRTARRVVAEGQGGKQLEACLTALDRLSQRSYAGIEPLFEAIVGLRKGGYDSIETENMERFAGVVRGFARSRIENPVLRDLVVYLDLLLVAGADDEAAGDLDPSANDTVKVTTAHAAKGLQWPVVFVGLANHHDFFNQGRKRTDLLPEELAHPLPGRPERRLFGEDAKGDRAFEKALEAWRKETARQEEFRTLYVALTRAEDLLFLSWAKHTPSRTKPSTLHPALLERNEWYDVTQAPEAGTVPAPLTLHTVAPSLFPLLSPVLSALNGTSNYTIGSTARPTAGSTADDPNGERRDALTPNLTEALAGFGTDPAIAPQAVALFEQQRLQLLEQIALIREVEGRVAAQPVAAARTRFALSFSQLETFEACPHRYYLRYVQGMPGAPKQGATGFGSALHRAVAGEAEKRRLGILTEAPQMWATIALGLEDEFRQGPGGETAMGLSADPVEAYLGSIDARATPLLIEEPFTLRIGDIALNGVIDRLHRLPDGTTEVVDYKTERTLRTAEQVRRGLQLPIYVLAARELFREITPPPSRAVMFFLRHNERVGVAYTRDDLEQVRERVQETAGRMSDVSSADHLASPETCRCCDFRATCVYAV
jgi:DNA helicase-2/ATP-dependent DNA helicase PcrA